MANFGLLSWDKYLEIKKYKSRKFMWHNICAGLGEVKHFSTPTLYGYMCTYIT